MIVAEGLLLFAAAIIGGGMNSVAGGGSFLTFPILLMTGMPPIAANATNTFALWPGSLASVGAYRAELREVKGRITGLLVISVIGGLVGALALLKTPEDTFERLVPWLLLAATLVFAFGRRAVAWLHTHLPPGVHPTLRALALLLQCLIATYGGYFGAGIGILMLAMLELSGMHHIHQMNAVKTVLASIINAAAVLTFVVAGVIWWPQALLMMLGAIIGGYFGAHYARRLPPEHVRWMVLAIACTMTVYLFWRAY